MEGANSSAKILEKNVDAHGLPFSEGVLPLHEKVEDQLIANTYKPALEIIGLKEDSQS